MSTFASNFCWSQTLVLQHGLDRVECDGLLLRPQISHTRWRLSPDRVRAPQQRPQTKHSLSKALAHTQMLDPSTSSTLMAIEFCGGSSQRCSPGSPPSSSRRSAPHLSASLHSAIGSSNCCTPPKTRRHFWARQLFDAARTGQSRRGPLLNTYAIRMHSFSQL